MKSSLYSLAGYCNKLRMTRNRVLLVEGPTDKRVFEQLIDKVLSHDSQIDPPVEIDTAESIKSPDGRSCGNGAKIELLCAWLEREDIGNKLVGFVDREFRNFCLRGDGPVHDELGDHLVQGRLVWSRGHSIENYCFDFRILKEALTIFSCSDETQRAIEMFECIFEPSIRLACAAGLAGNDTGFMNLVRCSIDWEIIRIAGKTVDIEVDEWKTRLMRRQKTTEDISSRIIDRYLYWQRRVDLSNQETTRWLCDGHLGHRVIWAVYARCVYEICGQNRKEASRVLGNDETVRFNACIQSWIRGVMEGIALCPSVVLEMLGIKVPYIRVIKGVEGACDTALRKVV